MIINSKLQAIKFNKKAIDFIKSFETEALKILRVSMVVWNRDSQKKLTTAAIVIQMSLEFT